MPVLFVVIAAWRHLTLSANEDVHCADGVMAIVGELDRAGLIDANVPTVHAPTLGKALKDWDIMRADEESVLNFCRAALQLPSF